MYLELRQTCTETVSYLDSLFMPLSQIFLRYLQRLDVEVHGPLQVLIRSSRVQRPD